MGAKYLLMTKTIRLARLVVLLAPMMLAGSPCPVKLLNGTVDQNVIRVTFRNTGRLSIRQIEFNCKLIDAPADRATRAHCSETKAHFLPETEYTTAYNFPDVTAGSVLMSLKSVTFSDGSTWKPSNQEPCEVLKIRLANSRIGMSGS